jgi:hypothetical protein
MAKTGPTKWRAGFKAGMRHPEEEAVFDQKVTGEAMAATTVRGPEIYSGVGEAIGPTEAAGEPLS